MVSSREMRADLLHKRASDYTGLSDFGDEDYRQGLAVILSALDEDDFDQGQAPALENLVVSALTARLLTQDQWRQNPGYAQRAITAPLIVIGTPRTGTTALHNLLSNDPQFQGIEKWITGAALVRPPRDQWDDHPQYAASQAMVAQMHKAAPDVMKAHGVEAHEVDECLLPMAQSFTSNWFPSNLALPAYDKWLESADERPSYERYRGILQLVGLDDDRRWLLKNPSHVFGIDALLAVFPDAGIVQTHRHPVASLASLVNLLANVTKAYTGQDIDRAARLARETHFWAEAVKRSMAAQDRHPERFCNVLQADIRRDPLGIVETIYAKLGLNLSSEARTAMEEWAACNSDNGKAHDYEPVADMPNIEQKFAEYIQRYQL